MSAPRGRVWKFGDDISGDDGIIGARQVEQLRARLVHKYQVAFGVVDIIINNYYSY